MGKFTDLSDHNYRIIRELGSNREGGRVSYLATTLNSNQQVVIKQFRFLATDASWRGFKVYEREIQILTELNHPRIPKYIDSFETEDGFCMVQEYKDAPSLASLPHVPAEIVKKIAISVLEILEDLQSRTPPIIHRDIKPENILIDSEYNAYLIDFGLAKIRDEEVAISSIAAGTPGFMPPEEVFNRALTEASDLYSLGATLICLLTHTPSGRVSSLIDENYRFNFQDLMAEVNPLFIDWLKRMVEPNIRARIPNARVANNALKPIDVNDIESTRKIQPVNNLLGLKTLLLASIIVATLGSSIQLINNLHSPPPQPIKIIPIPPKVKTNSSLTPEQLWYQKIKPHCNSVEVVTAMKSSPPPETTQGIGYAAACYALAGKIEAADVLIQSLPAQEQQQAASIVFGIGHPVADAGDDESAGPIMNLVIKYQPNNYMALYHAGMSSYILGDLEISKRHLQKFLEIYQRNDGWRQNAITVLNRMEKN